MQCAAGGARGAVNARWWGVHAGCCRLVARCAWRVTLSLCCRVRFPSADCVTVLASLQHLAHYTIHFQYPFVLPIFYAVRIHGQISSHSPLTLERAQQRTGKEYPATPASIHFAPAEVEYDAMGVCWSCCRDCLDLPPPINPDRGELKQALARLT